MKRAHVHQSLDQPVTAIGGHYVLTKEVRLPFRGREVLYLVGYAVIDTSCCGVGGFAYALVPGFILEWQGQRDEQGRPMSQVEPIRDEAIQAEIGRLIHQREVVHQVRFA